MFKLGLRLQVIAIRPALINGYLNYDKELIQIGTTLLTFRQRQVAG
jgi:hypothetical protein